MAPPSSVRDVPIRGSGTVKKASAPVKPVFSSSESESESESESKESTSGPDSSDSESEISADENREIATKTPEKSETPNETVVPEDDDREVDPASELADKVVECTLAAVSTPATPLEKDSPIESPLPPSRSPDADVEDSSQ